LIQEIIEWGSKNDVQLFIDGQEIAYVRIDRLRYAPSAWYVIELFVNLKYRQMGYAYKLFSFLRQEAKDAGIKELKLTACGDDDSISGDQLIEIYSNWGFEVDAGEYNKMTFLCTSYPGADK